jgi:F0F1-type ATP synthase delta subunit
MRTRDYTQAVVSLIEDGREVGTVLQNLSKTLKARGHARLYPAILRDVERLLTTRRLRNEVVVTVGRADDAVRYTTDIEHDLAGAGLSTQYHIEVDPRIIGGFRVRSGSVVLDRTFKERLIALYRSIIK